MKKKILLTGASGSLGLKVYNLLKQKFVVIGVCNKKKIDNLIRCDLNNRFNLCKLLNMHNPDIIIHCAALTNVDYCERFPKEAYAFNFKVTKNITKWIQKYSKKTKLIFISSDQVYGNLKSPHYEKNTKPINVYGKTKLKAELSVKKIKKYLILRVNFVGRGSESRESLSDWIAKNFKKRNKINLFKNIFFNPITNNQLAKIIKFLINKNISGTYNVGCSHKDPISKAFFAIEFVKKIGIYNDNYIISDDNMKKRIAFRPADTSMNINKIQKKIKMPKFSYVLKDLANDYVN